MDKIKEKQLKKLVKGKDSNAMLELAKLYGGITSRKGLKLYIKAAKLNNVKAQADLAIYYYSHAISIIHMGASYATENRGDIYINMSKAQDWCTKAVDNGDKSSVALLQKIKEIMWHLD